MISKVWELPADKLGGYLSLAEPWLAAEGQRGETNGNEEKKTGRITGLDWTEQCFSCAALHNILIPITAVLPIQQNTLGSRVEHG